MQCEFLLVCETFKTIKVLFPDIKNIEINKDIISLFSFKPAERLKCVIYYKIYHHKTLVLSNLCSVFFFLLG